MEETPQLWPEESARTGISLVIHDQVAKSPSRQVGVTRLAKDPARGLLGDYPGGDACFGPRRATSTPHGLTTENSAQIPLVGKTSHWGGVVEVLAYNLPPGLGSYTQWDKRLDARLAGALMGIQAIKGVELGDGFQTAKRRGSVAHDEIEKNSRGEITRRTDRAGGTEGGISTGQVLRVKVAMKPISTVPKALDTIDVATGEAAKAINQRSDVCAVPASGIVAEAMTALVLADAVLEKFGGDSVQETKRNFENYIDTLEIK